ncbi:MAG: diguanylate cyclase [Nitrospinae bacterium]|nr:diguanylate cyclase [Nitrospinota bacterium]
MMPGMDGFEVCKRIKENPETNGTAVIFLSADKLAESKVHGLEAGAFDYVEKPFSYAEIFARLRAFRREWMYRREILSLIEFSRKTSALDFDRLMETFKQGVGQIFYADRFSLFLWKKETRTFKLAVSNREFSGYMGEISVDDSPLMRDVVECGEIIFIRDIRQSKYKVRNTGVYVDNYAFGIPLLMEDKTIGVLNLNGNSAGFFDDHDLSFMRLGAELIARAVSNALQYKTIQEIAVTDPLTGIYNRRYFFERLRNEFERAHRYKSDMTIIMADLDHFKKINDNYGHESGDRALTSTAEILKKHLRKIDVVARYGGEEFILLLPEISKDKAYKVADRIRRDVESQAHDPGGGNFYVTISMGIADTKSYGVTTADDLIKRADENLYKAKSAGRNRVVV